MKKIIIIAELIFSVGIFLACSHDDDVESKENGTTSSITPNSSIANPIDLGLTRIACIRFYNSLIFFAFNFLL